MTDATRDKWRTLCAELGYPDGASFSTVMMDIKRLKQARDREITLTHAIRDLLQFARREDRGKIRCTFCKAEFFKTHTGSCPVGRLKDIVKV